MKTKRISQALLASAILLTSRILAGALLMAATSAAQAAIVSFGSRAAFDAAYPGSVLEDWDGFSAGTTFTNGTGANGITYNSSTGNALVTSTFLVSSSPNGLGRTGVGFFLGTDSITFTFDSATAAFGIDINTFATAAGAYSATTDLGDIALSAFDPFPASSTGQFVGFTSDTPFSSVTIASPGNVVYTLDTLRAVEVPEPGSLALLGLGLAVLGARSRRRSV
ncbi:PEP-CTERM sorting domain-containing protein [Rhodoferax ferrireducens]|uniref:PEP-CTERM sorting domain-containing protein n=1 Tax=Rhodoferax ferrireducens TaxID=192843 RepID=UPI000E0DBFE0|nr:PEP-CTERM sorting domain-containing protein [Rhodoferax ferrireducens]